MIRGVFVQLNVEMMLGEKPLEWNQGLYLKY